MLNNKSHFKPKRGLRLALGGGGARALAHIGVLKAIEEQQLPITRLSGTSGGAIIAALYAQTASIRYVIEKIQAFLYSEAFKEFGIDLFTDEHPKRHTHFESIENLLHYIKSRIAYSRVLMSESLYTDKRLIDLLSGLFGNERIEQTQIPLQIAAVEVDTGEDILLEHGPILQAVAGSSAIPGLFSPVEFDGMRLIDGAVLNNVPLIQANKQNEVLIGVDVSRSLKGEYPKRVALDYVFRADAITTHRLNELHLHKAEIVIRPDGISQSHWADFRHPDEYIQSGEEAALERISEIKTAMNHRESRLKHWLQKNANGFMEIENCCE